MSYFKQTQIELKKSLETFGEPLTIINKNKKIKAIGLFDRITKQIKSGSLNQHLGAYCTEKFNLLLYTYSKINSIETITNNNNDIFEFITGYYDKKIGCWRLIVQKINNANIKN